MNIENESTQSAELPEVLDEASGYAVLRHLLETDQLRELYRLAPIFLAEFPENWRGYKLFGLACLYLSDVANARLALVRADALNPDDGEILDYLGVAYNLQGQFKEAEAVFHRALAADPKRAEAWVNMGKNRRDAGDRNGAAEAYRRAVEMHPTLVSGHNNLGVVLCELGRPVEALPAFEKALELQPQSPWAHVNLGNVLKDLKRYDDAIASYDRALQMTTMMHEAWSNLADVLQLTGKTEEAVAAAERALNLDPEGPETLNTLGTLYAVQKRMPEAEALFRRALAAQPDNAVYWLNLGNALAEVPAKVDAFRRALALKPDFEQAQSHLAFHLNYLAEASPEELQREAVRYGELLARRITPRQAWDNDRNADRPLRIGLVSADLCQHPVAYFLEATLHAFKDKKLSFVAYSGAEKEDEVSARLRTMFAKWHNALAMTDDELVAQIAADRIDILLDVSGHTAGHRLPVFAAKPAPVQATWLGYVGTTGLSTIDYLIADRHVLPENLPPHTVETVWRLPECYMSFTRPPFNIDLSEPPCLTNGYPTFGCFNNFAKVNDRVLDTWARVMAAVPDARLLLRAKPLSEESARQRIAERFAAFGVAVERLEMGGSLPTREDGMRDYNRIDIALDPFPYTGATSSVEALWMGVPVLTLRGDRFIARVGESFNRNLGLDDWIAEDIDDYIARAARLCRNTDELARLRRSLRTRGAASPLGNPVWFANQLEVALRGMWRRYCAA